MKTRFSSFTDSCCSALRKIGFSNKEVLLLLFAPEDLLRWGVFLEEEERMVQEILEIQCKLDDCVDLVDRKLYKIEMDLLEMMLERPRR